MVAHHTQTACSQMVVGGFFARPGGLVLVLRRTVYVRAMPVATKKVFAATSAPSYHRVELLAAGGLQVGPVGA